MIDQLLDAILERLVRLSGIVGRWLLDQNRAEFGDEDVIVNIEKLQSCFEVLEDLFGREDSDRDDGVGIDGLLYGALAIISQR